MTTTALESLAQQLESSGNFKVLRRFVPVDSYASPAGLEDKLRHALVLDTETTGLNKDADRVVELGYLMVRFLPETGQIFDVVSRYCDFTDPGIPIAEEASKVSGISNEDVAGKTLDRERIAADIVKADVIIAHNAPFDRAMLEHEFDEAKGKWWICSSQEGPWKELLTGSSKQEYLAYKVCGVFYDGHRALNDAEVLLHILAHQMPDGRFILKYLLDRSRTTTYRVWATDSPFDKKDYLKLDRGYKWSDGTDPKNPIKAWYKDGILGAEAYLAELDDLAANVYKDLLHRNPTVTVDEITGRERHTARFKNRTAVRLEAPSPEAPAAAEATAG